MKKKKPCVKAQKIIKKAKFELPLPCTDINTNCKCTPF